jgi:hypothetical protein
VALVLPGRREMPPRHTTPLENGGFRLSPEASLIIRVYDAWVSLLDSIGPNDRAYQVLSELWDELDLYVQRNSEAFDALESAQREGVVCFDDLSICREQCYSRREPGPNVVWRRGDTPKGNASDLLRSMRR